MRDDDARSVISGLSYATKSYHPAASEYGYGPGLRTSDA